MIIASIYMCKWSSSWRQQFLTWSPRSGAGTMKPLLWYNKFCAHQHILPGEEVKILIKFSWPSHFQPPSLHQLLFRPSPYHRTFESPRLEHSVFPEILLMTQTWFCKAITLQLKNKLTKQNLSPNSGILYSALSSVLPWLIQVLAVSHTAIGELDFCCCSVAKSCPTVCDPMDCSSAGSSVLH